MADLSLKITAANLASSALEGVAGSVKALGAQVVEFAKQSVAAFAEQERADAQLARVAGELTDVFKAQAAAFQATLGVSDDMVEKIQTLALTAGAAPSQVKELTGSVLDYAAATGQDATNATESLIRGVQSGTGNIKALGISFQATGDFTKDLAAATQKLSEKYAGAGAAAGETLEGSLRKAKEAFGELQETFGGFIASIDAKFHILDKLTLTLKSIQALVTGDVGALLSGQKVDPTAAAWVNAVLGGVSKGHLNFLPGQENAALPDKPRQQGFVRTGPEKASDSARDPSRLDEDDFVDAWGEYQKDLLEEHKKGMEKLEEADAKAWTEITKNEEKAMLAGTTLLADELKKQQALIKAQEKQYAAAGDAIGAAFVNNFAAALGELAAGGEFDIGAFFGDLVSMIGGIVGGIFGGPLGASIGAAPGRILSGFARGSKRKRHDGGWADDELVPRFHDGGWPGGPSEIPAMLLSGERVLSRTEVGRMGGPAAVDKAAAGHGGSVTINLTTIDAKSTREFFEDRGGRGFYNAVRSGRGDVSRLLLGGKGGL